MIDAAELHRVYPLKDFDAIQARTVVQVMERGAPTLEAAEAVHEAATPPDNADWRIRAVTAEAQLAALRELLAEIRRREDDLRAERDRWAAQAERLALPALAPALERRSWFPWRRTA